MLAEFREQLLKPPGRGRGDTYFFVRTHKYTKQQYAEILTNALQAINQLSEHAVLALKW
jgi:hypothetical protein